MEISENSQPAAKPPRSAVGQIYDFLSGFGLATVLLLVLGVLTWFATLEQVEHGLYPTLTKYFSPTLETLLVIPDIPQLYINGKIVPIPLPSGYWVCALLTLNLILGGIVRIRKGWGHAGNLISHSGIILLLVGGGVTHQFSERGHVKILEGESSNVAESFSEYVVEVAEIKNGKAEKAYVIRGKELENAEGSECVFKLPELPFDLVLTGYLEKVLPVSVNERAPSRQEFVADQYYLTELPEDATAEAANSYSPGCYARIVAKDGVKSLPFILAGSSFHPFSYRLGDRVFTLDMRRYQWVMPFSTRLDQFSAEFYPGTTMASKFVSKVTRVENGSEAKVTIQMNEPMRYEGLTFFQVDYEPKGILLKPGQKMYSIFEVVRNPSDKWPEYSLWIVAFGMAVTFLTKLGGFIIGGSRKKRHV